MVILTKVDIVNRVRVNAIIAIRVNMRKSMNVYQ